MVVRSFAALPHLFFLAREGATLFLAASNARFVAREDALRLHVHAGSGFARRCCLHALLQESLLLDFARTNGPTPCT